MNRWAVFCAVVGLGASTSCRSTGPRFNPRALTREASPPPMTAEVTNQLNPDWLRAPTNFFTIGPGDHLEIELLGEPGTRASTVVGPDGKIYYHLLPGVDVWGLTLAQAKERLEREMLSFVRQPPR